MGERFTLAKIVADLHIQERYQRLMARLLNMLAADGLLRSEAPDAWTVIKPLTGINQDHLKSEYIDLMQLYPEFDAELTLLGACGEQLAGVLTGTIDPLELLFPGGDLSLAEKLYTVSPVAKAYNALVQAALKRLIQMLPLDRPLRVLEIGAGTGGTTGFVLPCLPADRTTYTFTDVSPMFGLKAQQKFSAYPFVHYATLNIEQEPQSQGFETETYDLIIAANVIHATANLRCTLDHVQQLLKPGGLLLLLEMTYPERWVDLTFGLTDGWWRFEDDVRPRLPVARCRASGSACCWMSVLRKLIRCPCQIGDDAPLEEAVIIGQMPTQSARAGNWIIFSDRAWYRHSTG